MDWYSVLLNKEVLTALVSLIGLVLLRYTGIPEDIWAAIAAFLGVVIANMFVEKGAAAIGRSISRGLRESLKD
jgi:divalent metal cation (Fe/Co/Zn/Cd) transporter